MSNQQTVIMVPAKAVRQDLITETNNIVYMPLATTENPGVVKIGNGLNIDADGVLSFDQNEISISQISKNGVIIPPDENKIVNIVLDKTDVGLNNVDNTSDLNKPVSIYQQQALDMKLNKTFSNARRGEYLYVGIGGDVDTKPLEKVSVRSKEGTVSDVLDWLTFKDVFVVKAEGLASIGGDAGDNVIVDLVPELKNAIHNVSYNANNGVLSFNKADGTTLNIDLPLELLIKSGRYDESTGEIVLELANDEEIRIPVQQLINHYYADNTTLELVAVDNKLTFRIKDGAITTEKISTAAVTSDKILSVSADKIVGTVRSAIEAINDEYGRNISNTYQKIENSYNKTETDSLLTKKANCDDLPVVIIMGGA